MGRAVTIFAVASHGLGVDSMLNLPSFTPESACIGTQCCASLRARPRPRRRPS
jgi:hypothetical protein